MTTSLSSDSSCETLLPAAEGSDAATATMSDTDSAEDGDPADSTSSQTVPQGTDYGESATSEIARPEGFSMQAGVASTEGKGEPPALEDDLSPPPTLVAASSAQDHNAVQRSPRVTRWARRLLWSGTLAATALVSTIAGSALGLWLPLPAGLSTHSEALLSLQDLWAAGFRYQVTRPITILLVGIDQVPEATPGSEAMFSGRTDTMLLLRVDPEKGVVNVLSIPRDTQVRIPGFGITKINHANVMGGPALTVQTLNDNLGDIEIDRYVRVSTGAFKELVDLVGGVDVLVPKAMSYEDQTQKLKIDLQPGWQTLTGEQAEQFARFRNDAYGDIGRVQRQQILLKALRAQLTNPSVVPKLPQIVRILQSHVDTNLSIEEILALLNFGLELEPDQLRMVMLPGRFSSPDEYVASYWLMDRDASDRILQEFFQPETVALVANSTQLSESQIRIAVQNATGQDQVGHAVAQALRESGFDHVYLMPDWSEPLPETQIIAQRGDLESAQLLAAKLQSGRVVAESTGDLESDLTLRVGQDWLQQPLSH